MSPRAWRASATTSRFSAHTCRASSSRGDSRIAIAPEYQGRVMTSTAPGDAGRSHGWIDRELLGVGIDTIESAL